MPVITVQLGQCGNQVRRHPLGPGPPLAATTCVHAEPPLPAACTTRLPPSPPPPPAHPSLQLGCNFFSTLAEEFSSNDYGLAGVNEFFRPGPDPAGHYVARSVLIDMEPKVRLGNALNQHPPCMSSRGRTGMLARAPPPFVRGAAALCGPA